MREPDIRWKQRLQSYERALGQLSAGAALAEERGLSDLERQGLIQAFEFTHELAWKLMRDFLVAHGAAAQVIGSRDATRAAFAAELIEDADAWMEMIADRNRTSHTYNEETATEIAGRILHRYLDRLRAFAAIMRAQEDA